MRTGRRTFVKRVALAAGGATVGIVNVELNGKMEFAHPSSISPRDPQHALPVWSPPRPPLSNREPHSMWRTSRYGTSSVF
jgi:hypothetical protein